MSGAGAGAVLTGILVAQVAGVLFPPVPAAGQTGPVVATGVVLDARTSTPVAGATIVLEGPVDARTESRADGRWTVTGLEPGSYRLSAATLGYEERTLRVDLPLADQLVVTLETRALPLDALVVTASRRQQRLAEAPVAIEVIRREDLRRSGASDLASVLTERTGVQLQGGHPAGAGVMLQGMDSERVLVLVDGQPWVGRISGTADLSRIPASVVERVEVVKGPQATLYGSEAMGGVVNVITRRPAGGWSGSAGVTSGSQDRLDLSARVTGRRGALGFSLDAGRRSEDLVPGQEGEAGAGVRRHDGHARVVWDGSGGLRLEGAALLVDERQQWRTGQLRHFADNQQGSLTVQGGWAGASHRVGVILHGSRFDHLLRRGTRDQPPPRSTGDRQLQSLAELDALWAWAPTDDIDLDLGVEVGREWIDAEAVEGGEERRTTTEPYAQATVRLGTWSLVPGLRFSHSSRWGGHWTPRLAVMTRPVPELALRASVSSGYRVPSFKELALDFLNSGPGFGYVVRGAPDLEPERSLNVSGSVEWTGARAYARAQAFHNAFDGFIEARAVADSAGLTIYTYGNVANGHTAGIELETGWSLGALDTEVGWAWLVTEDAETGRPLLGRPEHSARSSLSFPFRNFRAHATATWTGTTPMFRDEDTDEVLSRDAFLRIDARLSRRVADRVDVALGVDNLLDRVPATWPGFAGRRIHLTLTTVLFGRAEP